MSEAISFEDTKTSVLTTIYQV